MSYGSAVEIGPDALILAFEEMLKTHLRATVAGIETAWGLDAGTIRVPDEVTGYTVSRKYGNDSAPSVRIYLDRNWLADQPRFPGAGAAWAWSIVRVRVRAYADTDIASERQVSVLCEAVSRVISKYFTAWHDKMLAAKCERVTDWRGPSLRERGQSEGFSRYGRDDRNTDEEADLTWEIYHRQAWGISYSKDLPTP